MPSEKKKKKKRKKKKKKKKKKHGGGKVYMNQETSTPAVPDDVWKEEEGDQG